MSTIMFTQSLAVVSRTVGSLPNAPALDAAPRIVKRLNSELVRRLVLAAIFEPRHFIPLEVLEDYMAFCGGWTRYVVRRSLQEMASRSMPTSIQTFPQPDEIVPAPRNALIVRKVAITIAKPRIPAPSAQELAFLLSSLDVCASAQEGLWLDNISVLLYGLQAEVPSRALSVVSPSEVHVNINLMLLLASRASSFPLLVDLGPETSIVEVASGDVDDYVSTVSPAGVSNRVLTVKKLAIAPRVSISNARDMAAVLGDLDICVSVPKGLWLDISISPRSLGVDISMAPKTISQLEDHVTIDLLLLLASRVASHAPSFPLLVGLGSDTSVVEVASDDVNFNQTLVEEDSGVIAGPQDALVKRFSIVTVESQVSIFNVRDITSFDDLDICMPASRGLWLDLPFLPHSLRFDILPMALGATSRLGNRVNIDLILLLASMAISCTSLFPRLVDLGPGASSIAEVISDEVSMDTDRTLIEDNCIPPIKKDPAAPLVRTLNPNAVVFVPPSACLPPLGGTQESVDSPKTIELEAPAPLSRRAKARRLAVARKRRAQLSEIHAAPSSTPALVCPLVYPSLNDAPAPPPAPAFHEYPHASSVYHTMGTMPASSFLVQPMHVPMPQSHHYPPFPSAPPPPVYRGPGYRHPSRMPAPRPPRQMYLDAHRHLPPAFPPTPMYGGPPMGQMY